MELRLRDGPDERRAAAEAAAGGGRVHPRVPGDRGGAAAHGAGRGGHARVPVRAAWAPAFVRSDNGPEFIAAAVKAWLEASGSATLYIEPGSPWENAYVESFNGKLEDELLNREQFASR